MLNAGGLQLPSLSSSYKQEDIDDKKSYNESEMQRSNQIDFLGEEEEERGFLTMRQIDQAISNRRQSQEKSEDICLGDDDDF